MAHARAPPTREPLPREATGLIKRLGFAKRAFLRVIRDEQDREPAQRRLSKVMWDTFTGSAPYRSVFLRSMHPAFLGRFGLELVGGLRSGGTLRPRERVSLATGVTGLTARRCAAVSPGCAPSACRWKARTGRCCRC